MAKPKQAFPRRVQGQVSQTFKEGDYVPLVVLIFKDGNPHNIHLPQKLFAVKEFKQSDVMAEYHFQHPQQPVMLNEAQPNIGLFNSAVCCFHNWLIDNGYCRSEGKADLTKVYLWTPEEIAAAKAEEAELAARRAVTVEVLVDEQADKFTFSKYEDVKIVRAGEEITVDAKDLQVDDVIPFVNKASQKVALVTKVTVGNGLPAAVNEVIENTSQSVKGAVNVGTIGHVDHGKPVLADAMERASAPVEMGAPQYPLDPVPEEVRA